MERGIKTFAEALRRKKPRSARAKLDRISRRLDTGDDYWQGYHLALEGMVTALESGDELTFLKQAINGSYTREDIKEHISEMQERTMQDFRPKDEIGYHAAWADILQSFLEMSERSKNK